MIRRIHVKDPKGNLVAEMEFTDRDNYTLKAYDGYQCYLATKKSTQGDRPDHQRAHDGFSKPSLF